MRKEHDLPDPPQEPFWKDEKLFKFITTRQLLAILMVALLCFVAAVAYAIIAVLSQQNELSKIQTERQIQRLQDQKRTDTELRNVVCLAAQFIPTGNKLGDEFRKQFHCPAYGKTFHPQPFPSLTPIPHPTVTITVHSSTTRTVTSSATATRTATVQHVAPEPARTQIRRATTTVTKTKTKTTTVTTPALPTSVCHLVKLKVLC